MGKAHVAVRRRGHRMTKCGFQLGDGNPPLTQMMRSNGLCNYNVPKRIVSMKKLLSLPIDQQCLRCVGFKI